jgi:signal transduction histidine kinase
MLIFSSIASQALSQKNGEAFIDSLKKEIPVTRTDTGKVKNYLRISDVYIDLDLDKALAYADSAAALAEKIKWEEGIAKSRVNYGNVYNFNGNYKKALENIVLAYRFYKTKGDKKNTATAAYTFGVANERMGNYVIAAEKYFEALHIFEKLPGEDRLTGNSLSAIAVIYFLQRDYTKSLDYSFKALDKQRQAKNTMGIANEYIAIADTYNQLSDSANAIKYNLEALEMQKKMDNKFGQALIYFQLGKLYHNNYDLALDYHLKAEKLFTALSDHSNFATFNRGEIGQLYFKMARQDKLPASTLIKNNLPRDKAALLLLAEQYLQKSVDVSRETGDRDNESAFSSNLAELQAFKGDYKNAYFNYRIFHQTQDSIYSQQNKNKIAALESRKEIDLKNKTIENKELQLSNQRQKMWLLITGIAFLIITGGLLFRQNRISKRTNTALLQLNEELEEANKVKAKFFGILSHDLRSPVANFINFLQLQKKKPGLMDEQQIADRENAIAGSAKTLLETMEGMLLWSKGQMEYFQPNGSAVPVNNLFDYLQGFFAGTQNIDVIFPTKGNLVVHTDEDYLRTIMQNLTANAVKAVQHTPGAVIEWKVWAVNNNVRFSLSDNGPGISEEQVKALYNENVNSGTKYGLGFHIIRDLAKSIGCIIRLQPGSEGGTTFILDL